MSSVNRRPMNSEESTGQESEVAHLYETSGVVYSLNGAASPYPILIAFKLVPSQLEIRDIHDACRFKQKIPLRFQAPPLLDANWPTTLLLSSAIMQACLTFDRNLLHRLTGQRETLVPFTHSFVYSFGLDHCQICRNELVPMILLHLRTSTGLPDLLVRPDTLRPFNSRV